MMPPLKSDVEARVGHALAMQPLAGAEFVHQIDGALLQHAGADAAFDIVAALAFKHDAIDAGAMQQQRQEQPGRTGADDADLRAHLACYCFGLRNAVSAPTSACGPS